MRLMIYGARTASIILAVCALALAFGLGTLWLPASAVAALAILWILGQRAHWEWIDWLMLVLYAGAAALGMLLDLSPIPLVVGLIAALNAWDLGTFARQLRGVQAVQQEQVLGWRHLRRLLVVDALGLLLAVLTLSVQVNLSFGLALVLGLIALVGLSRAIIFLRRETD